MSSEVHYYCDRCGRCTTQPFKEAWSHLEITHYRERGTRFLYLCSDCTDRGFFWANWANNRLDPCK